MSDLISREALLKKMNKRLDDLRTEYGLFDHYTDGFDDAIDMVNFSQTVDAVPVRHGRWTFPWTSPECSVCRKTQKWTSKYCPNCGAKMK